MRRRLAILGVMMLEVACTPPHSGSDAGRTEPRPSDAGTLDAAVPDADAGSTDAGSLDAAVPDADAGPGDAGSLDAGATDAGLAFADAGAPTDAGLLDAGQNVTFGDGGVLCSRDGYCWEGLPFRGVFHDISGAGSTVIAVGEGGAIATWQGQAWRYEHSPNRKTLRAVWLESAVHGWAVGDEGTLLEWDGATWALRPFGLRGDLLTVSGAGDAVYMGGVDGLLTLLDGVWYRIGVELVRAVHVVSPQEVYAAGEARGANYLWHFDGNVWSDLPTSPDGPGPNDAVGSISKCGSTLFVAGWGGYRRSWSRNSGQWSALTSGDGTRVRCIDPNLSLVFGSERAETEKTDVAVLMNNTIGAGIVDVEIRAAWVDASGQAWLAGANGMLGTARFSNIAVFSQPPIRRALRVAAFTGSNVWIVEPDGTASFDGSTWVSFGGPMPDEMFSRMPGELWWSAGSSVHRRVGAVSQQVAAPVSGGWFRGTSGSDFWIFDWNGRAARFDGTTFVPYQIPFGAHAPHLTAREVWLPILQWGGVAAPTLRAELSSADGGVFDWHPIPGVAASRVEGRADEIYLIEGGTLSRWNGVTAEPILDGVSPNLFASTNEAVYAVRVEETPLGQRHRLIKVLLGTTVVTRLDIGTTEPIRSLSATTDGHVWLTTVRGGLLHFAP